MTQVISCVEDVSDSEIFGLYKRNLHALLPKLEFGKIENSEMPILIANVHSLLHSTNNDWKMEGLKIVQKYPLLNQILVGNSKNRPMFA